MIDQTYESEWEAAYEMKDYLRTSSMEWGKYKLVVSKLVEEQRNYLARFDELKKKIHQRKKKKEEFESAKKDLESKQQSKKPDQAKIAVADIDFRARKSEFERLDGELMTELPDFYEYRKQFYQTDVGTWAKADHSLLSELIDYLTKAMVKFSATNGVGSTPKLSQKVPLATAPSDTTNPFSEDSSVNDSKNDSSLYPTIPKSNSKESPVPRTRISIHPSTTPTSTPNTSENRKSAAPTPQLLVAFFFVDLS